MALEEPRCLRCSRPIIADDSVIARRDGRLSHLDCRMPRALSADERAVLIFYCFDHAVAECPRCRRRYREIELTTDYVKGHSHLCPTCDEDLTDLIRAHVYSCAMAPEAVRRKARMTRDQARLLAKQSRQLRDDADLLSREAEALLASVWQTARQQPGQTSTHVASYRGWQIEPQSYQCALDRWCPKASVRAGGASNVHTQIALTRTFTTRHEADTHAIAMGKDLIDDLLT
jgi:hypothetical protein